MASSRKTGTNENISTFGNETRDYTSLFTWEADTDYDLVTACISEVVECYNDASSYKLNGFTLFGATTNASYFRIIRPALGHEHRGDRTKGVKFIGTALGTQVFYINENYDSIQDVVVSNTYNNSNNKKAIIFRRNYVSLVGLILHDVRNIGTGIGVAIDMDGGGSFQTIVNCIIDNCDYGVRLDNEVNKVYVHNNTVVNCDYGYYQAGASGQFHLRNCIAENNTVNYTGTFNTKINYTDDDGVIFVDFNNNDFRLSEMDTVATDNGVDLSSYWLLPFNDDIRTLIRDVPWDIGAFKAPDVTIKNIPELALQLTAFIPTIKEIKYGTISGKVTLAGTPAEGAIVRLINQNTEEYIEKKITGADGNYEFKFLDKTFRYHIVVEYEIGGKKYNAKSQWGVEPYKG